MKRWEFIAGLGGAAAAWPLEARAQQAMPLVGFSVSGSAGPLRLALAGFEDGLKENGYIAGQNVTIEYRFAEGQFDRFPGFIAEFIRSKANVIVTSSNPGALTAKKSTSAIPVVFSIGEDPVKLGLVPSLNRPGGNLTGVYQFATGRPIGQALSTDHWR
jgi:putative ABC transport system substrate-binding protein